MQSAQFTGKRDETDDSLFYAYLNKYRISHEKLFSGLRRSEAVLYTKPAAIQRFHGALRAGFGVAGAKGQRPAFRMPGKQGAAGSV